MVGTTDWAVWGVAAAMLVLGVLGVVTTYRAEGDEQPGQGSCARPTSDSKPCCAQPCSVRG